MFSRLYCLRSGKQERKWYGTFESSLNLVMHVNIRQRSMHSKKISVIGYLRYFSSPSGEIRQYFLNRTRWKTSHGGSGLCVSRAKKVAKQ